MNDIFEGVRIVRLQSGEDIIAGYSGNTNTNVVVLDNPMHLIFKRTSQGTVMMMLPWLPIELIKDNIATVLSGDILTIVEPKDLKEVIGKDGKKELVHPTCGKVLPKGEKKVKPGYYIYEFYKPKPGKKDYKKYPGLIPDKHPDGLCLPCCFDKYNTVGRIKATKKCYETKEEKQEKEEKLNKKG
jgi:hypothetical protein